MFRACVNPAPGRDPAREVSSRGPAVTVASGASSRGAARHSGPLRTLTGTAPNRTSGTGRRDVWNTGAADTAASFTRALNGDRRGPPP